MSMNWGRALNTAMFLLPFLLFSGRALQQAGLLVLGMGLPVLVYGKLGFIRGISGVWLMACLMMGVCFLFPMFDLGLMLFEGRPTLANQVVQWRTFLGGPLSFFLLLSGLFLMGIAHWSKPHPAAPRPFPDLEGVVLLRSFVKGLFWASVILGLYSCLQFLTGYSIYEVAAYRPDRIMAGRFYRVTGFLEHPVAFAGLSLASFAFALALGNLNLRTPQRFLDQRTLQGILGIHFLLIAMSGTRMALVVAVLLVLMMVLKSKASGKVRLKMMGAVTIGVIGLSWLTGIASRFWEAWDSGQILGNRLVFWQVHWQVFLDHPFFGAGHHWLKQGGRDYYYNLLGHEGFLQKYSAHNIYLEILSNVGVVGFLALFVSVLWMGVSLKRRSTTLVARFTCSGLFLAFLSLLIFGFTQNTLFDTSTLLPLLYFFWLLFWVQIGEKEGGTNGARAFSLYL